MIIKHLMVICRLFVVAVTIMFFYKNIIKYISYVCFYINGIGIYISYLNAIEHNLIAS